MLEFEVQRCTRRCAKTERELQPGETFFSVLVPEQGKTVRYDYCQQAWEAPPEEAIGFWKSQMPSPHTKQVQWAPNDVMLDYFQRLEGDESQADVRYILALLMIRRRILRLEESQHAESGRERLILYCPRNENEYQVPVITPSEQRIREIQQELSQLLFAGEGA